MPKITIGRSDADMEDFGAELGTGLLGKHLVGEGSEAHAANPIRMDIARPHVIGVFGKRGTGKSYSLGVIAEELVTADESVSQNIATMIVDPMGIYWSMKFPNEDDAVLLDQWDMKPDAMDIDLFIPEGQAETFRERDIPFDKTFTLRPSDLSSADWAMAFDMQLNEPRGILLERVLRDLREDYDNFAVDDMIEYARTQGDFDEDVRKSLVNRLMAANDWGIFSAEGTALDDLYTRGGLSILDVSSFGNIRGSWSVKSLVVGLLAKKILQERMASKRLEEIAEMEGTQTSESPIVWMIIDEAHQFIPNDHKTPASDPLLSWVKIGREPGVSLVLATQQPYKLNADALSQCDIILSHRLTDKSDIDALKEIMATYMRYDITTYIDNLPRVKGAAIGLDDNSERVYSLRVRPRLSWHAGGTPAAIKEGRE
ncbi:MAG: ATP-binding protein [Candidatus Nanohaloarchaeota archaeon QJJ-5]|nr:ATP-binding protein [Candidatus Nanohaloarchaeota archaeon QJJ-5]